MAAIIKKSIWDKFRVEFNEFYIKVIKVLGYDKGMIRSFVQFKNKVISSFFSNMLKLLSRNSLKNKFIIIVFWESVGLNPPNPEQIQLKVIKTEKNENFTIFLLIYHFYFNLLCIYLISI